MQHRIHSALVLYLCIIASAVALWPSSAPRKVHHFDVEDPTELDKLYEMREQMMLADPATGRIPEQVRSQEMAFYNAGLYHRQTRNDETWNSAGPFNVGGRTRALAIDATNEDVFIAAGVSGGIFRSTDAGQSWQLTSDTVSHQGIVSLCQDVRVGYENVWYAVGGEASGNSASGGGSYYLGDGCFKSIDSGKSWQPIASTAVGQPNSFSSSFQVCWRIKSHPRTDSATLFLATYGAIFRSVNGGTTFQQCLGDGNNQSYYTDIEVAKNGTLYATMSSDGTTRGFYRSTNAGLSWANITPTNLLSTYERTVIGINPNNENEVFFFSHLGDSTNVGGTRTGNFQNDAEWIALLRYNYISGDGSGAGGVWVDLSKNLPATQNTASGSFDRLNCQGGYDMYVKVQPSTNSIFIGGTNIFRSTTAFADDKHTTQIGGYAPNTSLPNFGVYANHHPDCHDLLFFPSNANKILSASDGGVHLCTDANASTVTWISCNNGYLTTQPYTVTLEPTQHSRWLLSGFQDNGNFVTTNFTDPKRFWTMPFNGDGAYNYIAANREFFIMSTQQGKVGIFKLNSKGERVARRRIDPAGPAKSDYVFINPFAVDPNDDNILYLPAGKRLWRHNNLRSIAINDVWEQLGSGWYTVPDTITSGNTSSGNPAQITAIAVSKSPANVVYIGTSTRDIFRIDNANTTSSKMVKLTKAPLANGFVSCIAVDETDGRNVIVVFSNYNVNSIYISQDSGSTWKYCGGNLEKGSNPTGIAPSVRWVDIVPYPDGSKKYYAATSIGLYSTNSIRQGTVPSKDSTIWTQEAAGLIGTTVCNYITHRTADQTVAVSTHGKGTFVLSNTKDWPLPDPDTVPEEIVTVYPNPAATTVNIRLHAWVSTDATVLVHSVGGAVVKRIEVNGLKGTEDTIPIEVGHLANGIYLVEISDRVGKRFCKKVVISH
jgi:hypothetical protein